MEWFSLPKFSLDPYLIMVDFLLRRTDLSVTGYMLCLSGR